MNSVDTYVQRRVVKILVETPYTLKSTTMSPWIAFKN